MSNYSTIYNLVKTIDNMDAKTTTSTTSTNPFSSTMDNTGVTLYNSSINKLSTSSLFTFASSTLTTPNLTATSSITTPTLNASTGITTPTVTASTGITTPTLTASAGITAATLNATTSITTPTLTASTAITTPTLTASTAITTSGITINNNDILISGVSGTSNRKLKVVGTSVSIPLALSFDFGNFLPAETGTKTIDLYRNTFTAGDCTFCIYTPDNNGTTVRHKLFANSGKNSFLCNDADSQLLLGNSTVTSNYAVLQLQTTTKGLLLPRLTTDQLTTLKNNCSGSEIGLAVYDTADYAMKIFNGSNFVTPGAPFPATYFFTTALGNNSTFNTPSNVYWSTGIVYSNNWTSPIQSYSSNSERITFPNVGVYFIGGCISVASLTTSNYCNIGINVYSSLTTATASSSANLVSISGTADKPRPSFSYLINVTSAATNVSVFVYQNGGSAGQTRSILSESYIFAYRVA